MPELSKSEEAAFAAMQAETEAPPAPEPEPEQAEPEQEEAAPPPEGEEGDAAEPQEGAPSVTADKRPQEYVPHGALMEERRLRQQLEADNRRYAEERARIDERLRMIEEANRPAPPPEPDENVDPIGTIQYLRKELTDLKQQWAQGSQQWTAQQQAVAEARQIASIAEQDIQAFKAQTPDYSEAFQHWAGGRHAELVSYGKSPQEAAALLEQEQFDIARNALQRGISPAAHLYHIAKTRGYAGKPAAASNGRDDGASAQIQRVAAGQQRSPTLSGTGGGAVPTEMTASRLATMPNDDFADWIARNPKKADRLLGYEPPRGRRQA